MQIDPRISEILRRYARGIPLAPDLPLGSAGLALDSIALVEVLLECEEVFSVPLAADLLSGPPLTVGALVAAIERGRLQLHG